MSNYQLIPIANSPADTIFNWDVTQNEQYLGRLYVFPTTDEALGAMGIEKKWFLTHRLGDFVVGGHVSATGEWSLSAPCSLELSGKFSSQAEVFDTVFGCDYIKEYQEFRDSRAIALPKQDGISFSLDRAFKPPTNAVGTEGTDDGSNDSDSGSQEINRSVGMKFAPSIPNLNVLVPLLTSESEEELEEQSDELKEVEVLERTSVLSPMPFVLSEEVDTSLMDEIKRQEIESALLDTIVEEYRERETVEFLLPPFGIVTVRVEQDYFVLRSNSDGRTILAATLDKVVREELEVGDAFAFVEALSQLEVKQSFDSFDPLTSLRVNTEQSRGVDESELKNAIASSSTDASLILEAKSEGVEDGENGNESKNKKVKGFEYGD